MKVLTRFVRSLLRVPDTPERTALAFAIGVFIGFSPLLGLHTLLGVGASLVFRLNRIAMLLGVWSNVPWVVVPYYGFATWLGARIIGMPGVESFPQFGLAALISAEFWVWLASQWRLLVPAFVGSTVLCALFAILAYPLALLLIRNYRNRSTSWN